MFVRYFQELFTARGSRNLEPILETMDARVTQSMNDSLLKEFTAEEVGRALTQMDPLKAPGPDGFSASFFQKNWASIGEEVSQAVIHILNNGCMTKELNLTYIALIPKIVNPTCVTEFRPISLCTSFTS